MALAIERRGPADLIIRDDDEVIAEIAGPDLMNVRFRPGGIIHVLPEVPIPLHWRQYANHQDPERNASQHPRLERLIEEEGRRVVATGTGHNGSQSIESRTMVELRRLTEPTRYEVTVRTELHVKEGSRWHVTPNPHHGELEFFTLFPSGTFTPGDDRPKRYQACYLQQGETVWRIPHHHLESADKHNIPMGAHDRFLWLLEDENPCFELLSADPVLAGLCAYMWDGHLAYSVCSDGRPVDLPGGSRYVARYRLSAVGWDEGASLTGVARERPAPGIADIPLYTTGLNRFERSGETAAMDPAGSWPWEFEVASPAAHAQGVLDRTTGVDDQRSLRISGQGSTLARWIATTIGPAFGEAEFCDHACFRLEAMVRTRSLSGNAMVAIRLHRSGAPGLFDPSSYEVFRAEKGASGDTDWERLTVSTPPISPPPDRIHILLEQEGSGSSWFDNVLLKECP